MTPPRSAALAAPSPARVPRPLRLLPPPAVRPSPSPSLSPAGASARAPASPAARPDAALEPVRLAPARVASPFAPGREVTLARVEGGRLARLGVRDGDHVALHRRDDAEHGDLAAVLGPDGRSALWKVYPSRWGEAEGVRLSAGDASSRWVERAPVSGVVVGVLRKFR